MFILAFLKQNPPQLNEKPVLKAVPDLVLEKTAVQIGNGDRKEKKAYSSNLDLNG